jgi:hypothetical protein
MGLYGLVTSTAPKPIILNGLVTSMSPNPMSVVTSMAPKPMNFPNTWEAPLAAVRALSRMTVQALEEGQVNVELVDQPIHGRAAVATEHLDQLRLFGTTLHHVIGKQLDGVVDALGLLSLCPSTINSSRILRRSATAGTGLLNDHDARPVLKHGTGG